MRKFICFLGLAALFAFGAAAQHSVAAAGGDASGSNGSASYSVGQLFYSLNSGTDGSLLHGVQQPYEISAINTSVNNKDIKLSLTVYPVPAGDYVKLDLGDHQAKNMNYHLLDLNGKVLSRKKITASISKIPLAGLSKGIYFLRVSENGKNQKTFKIIKN